MVARAMLIAFLLLLTDGARAESPRTYDRLERIYGAQLEEGVWGLPAKVAAMSADPYKFWRGGKDFFYEDMRQRWPEASANKDPYITQHGDLHIGNMGSYLIDLQKSELAIGLVDFDESTRAPVQFELVQGMVTLRALARTRGMILGAAKLQEVDAAFFGTYRACFSDRRAAERVLGEHPWPKLLLKKQGKSYEKGLAKFVLNGKFRPVVIGEGGAVKDVLRPVRLPLEQVATALAGAAERDATLRRVLGGGETAGIRARILDVALRTRLGSAGSQGLQKLFVLVSPDEAFVNHQVIIYLKEQIPTAGERAGLVSGERRNAAQRLVEDAAVLTSAAPAVRTWAQIGPRFYWVSVHDELSADADPEWVESPDDLVPAAVFMGAVAGASHRDGEKIAKMLTDETFQLCRQHASGFYDQLRRDWDDLKTDPRTEQAKRALQQAVEASRGAAAAK